MAIFQLQQGIPLNKKKMKSSRLAFVTKNNDDNDPTRKIFQLVSIYNNLMHEKQLTHCINRTYPHLLLIYLHALQRKSAQKITPIILLLILYEIINHRFAYILLAKK